MSILRIFIALLSALSSSYIYAGTQNANISTSITIIAPVALNANSSINFGSFAPGTMTSTIQVAADSSRSVTSGNATLASGSTPSAMSVTVTGAAGYVVALGYNPPSGNTINLTGPSSSTMPLSLISPPNTCTLNGSGQCTITVGSSISVAAGQTAGTYSGTVTVSAQYM